MRLANLDTRDRNLKGIKGLKKIHEKLNKVIKENYPPQNFKNLSAEEILQWLEKSNNFIKKFLSVEELERLRKIRKKEYKTY